MKKIAFFIFLFLILSIRTSLASSAILINEFSALSEPDWVEIYNNSSEKINVGGWVIRDSTESNKINLTGYICPNSFRKFDFSNRLNNGGDIIKILDSESSTTPINEITYFSSTIPEHQASQSTSRQSQGSENWQVLTSPSPENDESCFPEPTPSPQPSLSPSPSPSSNPTPKSTPKISTKFPTPSPSPKPSDNQSKEVLGEKTDNSTPSANLSSNYQDSPSPATGYTQESSQKIAGIFIGVGSVLVAISAAIYLWYKRLQDKPTINKEKDRFEENKIEN